MSTKTTVIHHSADYDGIFCREIARKFLPDAELIGWDFPDQPLRVPESGTVYVLDLPLDATFGGKPGQFNLGVISAIDTNRLFWIDHHGSAIKSHPLEAGGYRIDGVAACRLAWQWFTNERARGEGLPYTKQEFIDRKVQEPIAVRLAGEYDIWDKRDPNAELFQHGLRSRDLDGDLWKCLLTIGNTGEQWVNMLLESGKAVQYAQRKQDEFVANNRSFDVQWEGLKFMAINAVRCNSLTFESATRPDHDALMERQVLECEPVSCATPQRFRPCCYRG